MPFFFLPLFRKVTGFKDPITTCAEGKTPVHHSPVVLPIHLSLTLIASGLTVLLSRRGEGSIKEGCPFKVKAK